MVGQSRTRWMMLFFVVLSCAADGARARAHTAHSGGDFTGGTISGNTASVNSFDGFVVNTFPGGNSAVFSNNSATNNTLLGYNILSGTPFDGITTNTGSGNGGNDSF